MNALLNAFEVDIAIVNTVTGAHPAPASAPATAWLGGGQLTGLVYKQVLRKVTAPRILRAKVLCQACLQGSLLSTQTTKTPAGLVATCPP